MKVEQRELPMRLDIKEEPSEAIRFRSMGAGASTPACLDPPWASAVGAYAGWVSWSIEACAALSTRLQSEADDRWLHVQSVVQCAIDMGADDLVVRAAWLHDVGYVGPLRRTGMHALDGAIHLRSLDAPPQIVSLIAYHTGAEYEADERGLAHELAAFDRPDQDLLDVLTLADLSAGPSGERVSPEARLEEIFERYPTDHAVHRAVLRSRSYLEECVARAGDREPQPM